MPTQLIEHARNAGTIRGQSLLLEPDIQCRNNSRVRRIQGNMVLNLVDLHVRLSVGLQQHHYVSNLEIRAPSPCDLHVCMLTLGVAN